jgi:hypothetical protein
VIVEPSRDGNSVDALTGLTKKIKVWREIVERIRTLHRLDALSPLARGVF